MRQRPEKVVVIGGGPAGLAAAHQLVAHDVEVTVLERAPWVGGLSMTVERNGFRFDVGGHRWFTKKKWLNDWFVELMREELTTVDRSSRIYFDGRYFDYPPRIGNVLESAGLSASVHAGASYLTSQLVQRLRQTPVVTTEQAYIEQFGPKLYEMFFRRYSEKVWGRKCSLLSADWVVQRSQGLSAWQTFLDAILKREPEFKSLAGSFLYPRLGYQRISERMREEIERGNGRVLLQSKATGVDLEAGAAVRYQEADGLQRELECDHVISTIPLNHLIKILRPKPPSNVMEAAKGLEFRNLITANVMLDREQVTSDTWLYIHDRDIGFSRIHEPVNWSREMAPPGKTSLCAEWFCSTRDPIWNTSDEEICEKSIAHLNNDLGFIERNEVIDCFALRAKHAYPIYTLDYKDRVTTIKQQLESHEQLLSIAGRGGTFRYNNADHSIETGLLVAKNLLGEAHDVDAVNLEPEYHEEVRRVPSFG